MVEFFDLVQHPLELDEKTVSTLEKHKDAYSMQVTGGLGSKRVFASKEESRKVYLHVLIDNEGPRICGESTTVYVFGTPADFYVPVSEKTAKFYGDIYKNITSNRIEDLQQSAEAFYRRFYSNNEHFPFYPMPITTRIGLSDDKKLKEFLSEREKIQNSVVVRYEDKVPDAPNEAAFRAVGRFVDSDFNPLAFLEGVFAENPILRMEYIKKIYRQEISDPLKRKVAFDRFRFFVPAVAYFMNSGPWYKTWIRFGLDPKKKREMYRYQVLAFKVHGAAFQVFEDPWIVEEVEKNRDTFLRSDCSYKTGFLTRYGLAQIKRMLKKGHEREEENRNIVFDVFD